MSLKRLVLFLAIILMTAQCFGAVHVDGSDDCVDTNYNPTYGASDDWTVCGWFKVDNSPSAEELVFGILDGSDVIIQIGFDTSNCGGDLVPVAFLRDDTNDLNGPYCYNGGAISTGTWYHFCMRYINSGGERDYYMCINGSCVLEDTNAPNGGFNTAGTNYAIGARMSQSTNTCGTFFDGSISDFAFWENDLTDAEILQLYKAGRRRMPCEIQPSSLAKYLPLDDLSEGGNLEGQAFRNECGSDVDTATGDDPGASGGQGDVSEPLSYP